MNLEQEQHWARLLVQQLVYPAILGTMFFALIPALFDMRSFDILQGQHALFLASELLMMMYFALDYYYTVISTTAVPRGHSKSKRRPAYGAIAGLCDLVALILLSRVTFLLAQAGSLDAERIADVKSAAILMSAIHGLWLIWVVAQKDLAMIPAKLGGALAFLAQAFWFPGIAAFFCVQAAVLASYAVTDVLEARRKKTDPRGGK